MECLTEKAKINDTIGKVTAASFKEKEALIADHEVDNSLDTLLTFKSIIKQKIVDIEAHIKNLEEITWFNIDKFDEDTKKNMNVVVSSTNDWITSLKKHHAICVHTLSKDKIKVDGLDDLMHAIGDLEETNKDLENVIFCYPNDNGFKSITAELSKL